MALSFVMPPELLMDLSREGIHPPGRQRELRAFGINDRERFRHMRLSLLPGLLGDGDLREQPIAERQIDPLARRAGQLEQPFRFTSALALADYLAKGDP
jgi:hypothetical protein